MVSTQTGSPFAVKYRWHWQGSALLALGIGSALSIVAWNISRTFPTTVLAGVFAVIYAFLPMRRPVVRSIVCGLAAYGVFSAIGASAVAISSGGPADIASQYGLTAYSALILTCGGSWVSAWTLERVRQTRMAERWASVTSYARANGHRLMWVMALGGRSRSTMNTLLQDCATGNEESRWVWGTPTPGTYVILTPQRRIEAVLTVAEQRAFDRWVKGRL